MVPAMCLLPDGNCLMLPTRFASSFSLIAAVSLLVSTTAQARAADKVDYAREVLPTLSENCFQCHGPDAGARKGNLRLDTKEGALRTSDPVVVPGKSAESALIQRLTTSSKKDIMPPLKSNKKLTAA